MKDTLKLILNKLNNIESTACEHVKLLKVLVHRINVTGADVTRMTEDMRSVSNRLSRVEDRVNATRNNQTEMLAKLVDMDNKIDYIIGNTTKIG